MMVVFDLKEEMRIITASGREIRGYIIDQSDDALTVQTVDGEILVSPIGATVEILNVYYARCNRLNREINERVARIDRAVEVEKAKQTREKSEGGLFYRLLKG